MRVTVTVEENSPFMTDQEVDSPEDRENFVLFESFKDVDGFEEYLHVIVELNGVKHMATILYSDFLKAVAHLEGKSGNSGRNCCDSYS